MNSRSASLPAHTVQAAPYRGAGQTVELIRRAALQAQDHYQIRLLVEHICKDLRSKDYLSEALAVHNFLWTRARYMRDPRTVELVRAPWVLAEKILSGGRPQIDCDDFVALLCALLLSCGFEVRILTVAFQDMFYQGERQYSHVFIQAREPRSGAWITLDPVAGLRTKQMLQRIKAYKIWPVA